MPQHTSTDWNDDLISKLRALWREGLATAEIGRRLGLSKNAVVGKAHRLRLTARPSPIRNRVPGASAPRRSPVVRVAATAPSVASRPALPAPLPKPADVSAEPVRCAAVLASSLPAGRVRACCWPLGEPGRIGFHFCDAPSEPGKPYCAEHSRVAYVRATGREVSHG